jgi:ribosomal-protein-alanine N-acetyltransferase
MAREIARIEFLCMERPWSKKDFEVRLNLPQSLYMAAFYHDEMIGFLGAQIAADIADITNAAVLESYRKQKVGTRLLRRLKKELWERGVVALYLEVRVSNIAARALYQKAGFLEVGARKNYYRDPREDALIMRREKTECEGGMTLEHIGN